MFRRSRRGIAVKTVRHLKSNWCRWVDLNNRPSPYESAALLLSYTGISSRRNWRRVQESNLPDL